LLRKQRWNGATGAALDERVEIVKRPVQHLCQFSADRRLACSHEADKNDQLRFACHIRGSVRRSRRAPRTLPQCAESNAHCFLSRILTPITTARYARRGICEGAPS